MFAREMEGGRGEGGDREQGVVYEGETGNGEGGKKQGRKQNRLCQIITLVILKEAFTSM